MAEAFAGARVRAEDIVDTIDADIVEDTSIGTVASNFTVTLQTARTALGGRLVYVFLVLQTTNALTATGGDITDVLMFTLDAAYRPSENVNAVAGTGLNTGEAIINSDGTVVLRSVSDSISAGRNIRVTATFLTAG